MICSDNVCIREMRSSCCALRLITSDKDDEGKDDDDDEEEEEEEDEEDDKSEDASLGVLLNVATSIKVALFARSRAGSTGLHDFVSVAGFDAVKVEDVSEARDEVGDVSCCPETAAKPWNGDSSGSNRLTPLCNDATAADEDDDAPAGMELLVGGTARGDTASTPVEVDEEEEMAASRASEEGKAA